MEPKDLEIIVKGVKTTTKLAYFRLYLHTLPDSDHIKIRQYINNTPTTPYTATISVLLDNPNPDYNLLLTRLKRGN